MLHRRKRGSSVRVWIFSDLHLRDNSSLPSIIPTADIALVAGDVTEGSERSIRWLADHILPHVPVVYCLGNHEYYRSSLDGELSIARRAAKRHGITLLEKDVADLGSVRVLGVTLWTDYAIYAEGNEANRSYYMDVARRRLSDHGLIYKSEYSDRLFDPIDAYELHRSSLFWLKQELGRPFDGKTVVLSHHAPHRRSIAPRWNRDLLTPAFVSDLADLIERYQPTLWVHGHTHTNFDYLVGATRIVCNPHGYVRENVNAFRWDLVVDI